jgi:hypothetical protein
MEGWGGLRLKSNRNAPSGKDFFGVCFYDKNEYFTLIILRLEALN